MNSFNFGRPVKIAGEVYCIDSDMETVSKRLKEQSLMLRKGNSDKKRMEASCEKSIDYILGSGAFRKIFRGRRFQIYDAISLLAFLANEIREWREEIANIGEEAKISGDDGEGGPLLS